MNMQYSYPATQNNGQIASSLDSVKNETISYQYDLLKRLVAANGLNWSEAYTYDGYGNLLQMSPGRYGRRALADPDRSAGCITCPRTGSTPRACPTTTMGT